MKGIEWYKNEMSSKRKRKYNKNKHGYGYKIDWKCKLILCFSTPNTKQVIDNAHFC